jgi:hypothetical protein
MPQFDTHAIIKLTSDPTFAEEVEDFLIDGEFILGSYSDIRDGVVFTNMRMISVDKQGLTASAVTYTSIPYAKVTTFAVSTPQLIGYTRILDLFVTEIGRLQFEFGRGTDVADLQRAIAEVALRVTPALFK